VHCAASWRSRGAASILAAPEVAVVGSIGESISLTAFDSKNSTSNTFDVDVSSESTANYRMIFRTENLKMVAGDYDVDITSKGISRWSGKKATYYITTEQAFFAIVIRGFFAIFFFFDFLGCFI